MKQSLNNFAKFHDELYIINAHLDSIMPVFDENYDYTKKNTIWHSDIPRIRQGGVDLLVFAVYAYNDTFSGLEERTNSMIKRIKELVASSNELELITNSTLMEQAKKDKKIGIVIGIEGAYSIKALDDIHDLYQKGVRVIGLTWNHANLLADGVGVQNPKGVTSLGGEAVALMNELGIVVDLSHLAPQGFWDVMELTKYPIIASHSNAKTLCGHKRNLTDEQLLAIKDNGGVVGICYAPTFLKDDGNATIDDIFEHLLYMKDLIGIDHIGLGTDFDGIRRTPIGMEDISKTPLIVKGLLERGFTEEEIRKVMGENFKRVFQKVIG
ncbi:MAG: dipeptidase [Halanaerobiales bacterium]|nr:dipeptidase [Halanaerobiales bacterium]